MTTDAAIAEAQRLAAQLAAAGAPVTLQGDPHTAKRIMFYHGATTGHAACTCPVVDEHGHNVNPGRQPLDGRAVGRAEGARKASETYARRRARKAADELAVIDPNLWDEQTRRIVATLATISTASPIDAALADAFPATTPAPYPNPRPRPDPDPRPRPQPHPRPSLDELDDERERDEAAAAEADDAEMDERDMFDPILSPDPFEPGPAPLHPGASTAAETYSRACGDPTCTCAR